MPAKYLGSEVNQLIGKINTEEAKNIAIPITANITGTYSSPSIKNRFNKWHFKPHQATY